MALWAKDVTYAPLATLASGGNYSHFDYLPCIRYKYSNSHPTLSTKALIFRYLTCKFQFSFIDSLYLMTV